MKTIEFYLNEEIVATIQAKGIMEAIKEVEELGIRFTGYHIKGNK